MLLATTRGSSQEWTGVAATRCPVLHHKSVLNLVLPTSVHLTEHLAAQAQLLTAGELSQVCPMKMKGRAASQQM